MSIRVALLLGAAASLMPHTTVAQTLFEGNAAIAGNTDSGAVTYAQACLACHGPRMEGSPFAPTLVGQAFLKRWRGKPAAELLTLMQKTMPPKGTAPISSAAYPDLLALLVRANTEGPAFLASLTQTSSPTGAPAGSHADQKPTSSAASLAPSAADAKRLQAMRAVTDELLQSPPDGDWLMWRRTFDATGYSPLKQIDTRTVRRLKKVWSLALGPSTNEITPLVHDGVVFIYGGNALEAVDAATGRKLWRYVREVPARGPAMRPEFAGQRSRVKSIAIYQHALFMPTADGHVVAVDARNGRQIWDHSITGGLGGAGLQLSSGPLVAKGLVILGASLGLTNKGGNFIVALDATTGAERWRFHTVARPGSIGGDTWNDAPLAERFGGGVWTTGSYDPQLDLIYFGVGNTYTTATLLEPRAGSNAVTRNDGLFTNATIALRPETGELVWYHQHHRRDVWDQDWAFEQTLVTLGQGANARRAVVTSGKTAIFEAVDAATGKFLFAQDTGLTNLFASIDPATGEKQTDPALEPVPGKTLLLCPGNLGARNWPATSFNPQNGLLFVPMLESCANFTYSPRSAAEFANGGSDINFSPQPRPNHDGMLGRLMAIDLVNQKVVWTHRQRMPLISSLLATAGGIVFMGDVERNFSAYDQRNGALLWQTRLPASAESTPISFWADGRQYIALVSGEGSHLGLYNRRLVPELPAPHTTPSLVVYAL